MDVAALIVAIVALLASIFSIGWQVYTWRRTRALDVAVDLSQLTKEEHLDEGMMASEDVLTVKVTNRSDFSIKVVGVAVVPDGGSLHSRLSGDWIGLPLVVKARDAEVLEIPATVYMGGLPDGDLQGCVELATGEEIRSTPRPLSLHFGGSGDEYAYRD